MWIASRKCELNANFAFIDCILPSSFYPNTTHPELNRSRMVEALSFSRICRLCSSLVAIFYWTDSKRIDLYGWTIGWKQNSRIKRKHFIVSLEDDWQFDCVKTTRHTSQAFQATDEYNTIRLNCEFFVISVSFYRTISPTSCHWFVDMFLLRSSPWMSNL